MTCKLGITACNDGSLFGENGEWLGRCKCKIGEWLNYGYEWSETPERYRKKAVLSKLDGEDVHFEGQVLNSVDEMKYLIENYDTLKGDARNEPARFILQGTAGGGKTQFAVTFAFEIFKSINWNKPNLEPELKHFYYMSVSNILKEGKLFDKDAKDKIWAKVRQAKILIIDDLGEELDYIEKNANGAHVKVDKRVNELLDFLKAIFDQYSGIVIVTTNVARQKMEADYDLVQPRFSSRLFTDASMLVYTFKYRDRDLRDEQKNDAVDKLKNRFKN